MQDLLSTLGTKWCGIGTMAKNDSDFGIMRETDMCCHQHDTCPARIKWWTEKYGLFNWHYVDMFLCSCEAAFQSCLKTTRMKERKFSMLLGNGYYNLMPFKPCFNLQKNKEGKMVGSYGKMPEFP